MSVRHHIDRIERAARESARSVAIARRNADALRHARAIAARDGDPFEGMPGDLVAAMIVTSAAEPPLPASEALLRDVLHPVHRVRRRVRDLERERDAATTRRARLRAEHRLFAAHQDGEVRAALLADLDAERAMLLPVIEAAVAGTSERWRLCRGRVIDEEGRALAPRCLKPWQVL